VLLLSEVRLVEPHPHFCRTNAQVGALDSHGIISHSKLDFFDPPVQRRVARPDDGGAGGAE